jgi:2-haloacid dehalogenase
LSSKRASPSIETVVFDLGGVLVDWNPRYLYRKLINDESQIEDFLARVCHGQWNEQQDAGRPFAEAIAERSASFPEHAPLIKAYFERWPEMLAGAIEGTVKVLEELHASGRYRLFALSNWSAETFPHAWRRFEFLKLFNQILLSGEEKLIKPDPRFFALLESRHGVRPEQSVFIDDVEKNILAARAIGYQTVRFTDAESLRHSLMSLGVK